MEDCDHIAIDDLGARVTAALRLAVEALQSSPDRYRHGAALIRGNRVINVAHNDKRPLSWVRYNPWVTRRHKENGIEGFNVWSGHAETMCLHGVDRDLI